MTGYKSQAYNLGVQGISIPEGDLKDPTDPTKGFAFTSVEDSTGRRELTSPYYVPRRGGYGNYAVKIHIDTTFRTYLTYNAKNPRGAGLWLAIAVMDFRVTGDLTFNDTQPGLHTLQWYTTRTNWNPANLMPNADGAKVVGGLNTPEEIPNWNGKTSLLTGLKFGRWK